MATFHSPPPGNQWRQANAFCLNGHKTDTFGTDSITGSTAKGAAGNTTVNAPKNDGKSELLWHRLAARLRVPWHGIDLVIHAGSRLADSRFVSAVAEAVSFLLAVSNNDDGPLGDPTTAIGL